MRTLILLMCMLAGMASAADLEPKSQTIAQILRAPLPPEDLHCTVEENAVTVQGATFRYVIDRANGAVTALEAVREGKPVVSLNGPAVFTLDDASLARVSQGVTEVLEEGSQKVVLDTKCFWAPGLSCATRTTIYNDGVLVSQVTLTPEAEVVLREGIKYETNATGRFSHFLHKRRDTNGLDCFQGALPEPGKTARMNTPTSCLEVYSDEAALAIFTDMGDFYRNPDTLDTAAVRVDAVENGTCSLNMCQHLILVGADTSPYALAAGQPFTFRTGLAVAPNRLPHPRRHDLRMFIWVGDEKSPYPSDDEIHAAAQLGYTLFQMHRLGPPGAPRPPEGEFDRVLKTVHDAGMLFIWTANADLMYRHDPAVAKLVGDGQWARWQGFNYGGKYKATMDSFCDTLSTCLASPNGLADYRIESDKRMLERYPVDGMYIDDNLAYENCTLWKEHGHPQQVYDCLIELHDMNWRRRQALRESCPHAVLIDHSSHAFVLPVIAAFDCHLYGEGYTFPSLEAFQATFGTYGNMYAQGCLWAGDSETTRCGSQMAYAFDLLSGGGQYSYLDWRLWPQKFPYASGVSADEPFFVRAYNLAQYYFGLYESVFTTSLPTTAPGTYAAIYDNRVWNERLLVTANMTNKDTPCRLSLPTTLQSTEMNADTVVYDVNQRKVLETPSGEQGILLPELMLRSYQTCLLLIKKIPAENPCHLWGGKRVAEAWDPQSGVLSVLLDGPEGVEETIVLATGHRPFRQVSVDGTPATFYYDAQQRLAYGKIVFKKDPVRLEVLPVDHDGTGIPEGPLEPDELHRYYEMP